MLLLPTPRAPCHTPAPHHPYARASLPPSFFSELGVHVEGYIATAAATVVVGEAGAAPVAVTGPRADVLAAAHAAAEAAVRLIKPGNTNAQVTEAVAAVAAAYGVTPAQGVLMHQMKRCAQALCAAAAVPPPSPPPVSTPGLSPRASVGPPPRCCALAACSSTARRRFCCAATTPRLRWRT
jgi:hypothetical protein